MYGSRVALTRKLDILRVKSCSFGSKGRLHQSTKSQVVFAIKIRLSACEKLRKARQSENAFDTYHSFKFIFYTQTLRKGCSCRQQVRIRRRSSQIAFNKNGQIIGLEQEVSGQKLKSNFKTFDRNSSIQKHFKIF